MAVTAVVGGSAATTTYNIDVASIVRRYNRMIQEVVKAQSSGISQTMPFDMARVKSYISAMQAFQAFVVAQPLLDCPETGPTEMPLQADAELPSLENESSYDFCQLVIIARDELKNSQSARLPTNLIKFDYDRQTSYLNKMNALLGYVATAEPLDLPESSPMSAVTGPGKLGV